jgi:signal peptidase I
MWWTVLLIASLSCVRAGIAIAVKSSEDPALRLRQAGEALEAAIVALTLVFLVVRPFVLQPFYIPSESMLPTLHVDDRILVNKLSYRLGRIERNEVIVFRAPKGAAPETGEEEPEFVKRVVGLPGDTVEVRDGRVFVNGRVFAATAHVREPDYDMRPIVVPPDRLFVMGDNRGRSNDSHRWGTLPVDRVLGRVTCIFWPPARLGLVH